MKKTKTIQHSDPRPKLRNALRAPEEKIEKKKLQPLLPPGGGSGTGTGGTGGTGQDWIVMGDPCPDDCIEWQAAEAFVFPPDTFTPALSVDGSDGIYSPEDAGDSSLGYIWRIIDEGDVGNTVELLAFLDFSCTENTISSGVSLSMDGPPDPSGSSDYFYFSFVPIVVSHPSPGFANFVLEFSLQGGAATIVGDQLYPRNAVPEGFHAEWNNIWMRIRKESAAVMCRTWEDGDTEPSTWMIEDTIAEVGDPNTEMNSIGFLLEGRFYDIPEASRMACHSVEVVEGTSSNPLEDFTSVVSNGWSNCTGSGGSSVGVFDEFDRSLGPYTVPNSSFISDFDLGAARPATWDDTYAACNGFNNTPTDGLIEVDGESLVASLILGGGQFDASVRTSDTSTDVYEIEMGFSFDTIPSIPTSGGFPLNSPNDIRIRLDSDLGMYGEVIVSSSYLDGDWKPVWFGPTGEHLWTPVVNRLYHLKLQYDSINGASSTKFWSEIESEPDWQDTDGALGTFDPPSTGTLALRIENDANANGDDQDEYDRLVTWKIHYIHDNAGCGQSYANPSSQFAIQGVDNPFDDVGAAVIPGVLAQLTRISATQYDMPSNALYVKNVYIDNVQLSGAQWTFAFNSGKRITFLTSVPSTATVMARYVPA